MRREKEEIGKVLPEVTVAGRLSHAIMTEEVTVPVHPMAIPAEVRRMEAAQVMAATALRNLSRAGAMAGAPMAEAPVRKAVTAVHRREATAHKVVTAEAALTMAEVLNTVHLTGGRMAAHKEAMAGHLPATDHHRGATVLCAVAQQAVTDQALREGIVAPATVAPTTAHGAAMAARKAMAP